jgi:spore coat protein CotH
MRTKKTTFQITCIGIVLTVVGCLVARGAFHGMGPGHKRKKIKLVKEHDQNGDGWLNRAERDSARTALKTIREDRAHERRGRRPPRRFGRDRRPPAEPGPKVDVKDVVTYADKPLYDPSVLRTLFLTFENGDWESEMEAFKGTDVEIRADLNVDGALYPGVGVRFRGASSLMMVPSGYKRSLNISLDMVDDKQRLYGYKTLNLLNCFGDSTMMSTVLYSEIASKYIPVPKANFVRVVVNGEYRGVYVNLQQFDKIFTSAQFGSSKGTRWKVPGSPDGDGGLKYTGEDLEDYEARYSMKSNDGRKAWNRLVRLCRVLNETPKEELEEKLSPILDIDKTLWFLAIDVVLVNSDGYWKRASDYSMFCDKKGQFHILPHDINEALRIGLHHHGGSSRTGVELDPLVGDGSERMPLRSRLLAVPALRAKYMAYVRQIAQESLDWKKIGPKISQYRALIMESVKTDTRKLDSLEEFLDATAAERPADDDVAIRNRSLRFFFEERRAFLLKATAEEGGM